MIYLDHNASTPVLPPVRDAVCAALERFGNPSSQHAAGRRARAAIEDAREQLAAAVGARPGQIVFTSGGTEACRLAIVGAALATGARAVLHGATEHRAVLAACRAAAAHTGATLHSVPVRPDGELEHEALERLLARLPAPALVALHSANNETGVEYRVFEIADRVHAAGGHLVVDAIQSLGKRPVDLGVWGADLATFSGHKIGAPPGVGAVFVRDEALFTPLLEGGGQERGRRAGTENVPGIVGFGVAARHLPERLAAIEATARLRDRLEDTLTRDLDGVTVHGRSQQRLPNTSFVSFAGVRGDALRIALDLAGVCVSGGSACASGAIEPSHVLRAMGVDEPRARSAVRFSLGPDTTPAEIERAAEHTIRLVRRQRRRGPCADAPTPP